jgi:hypothetical protein
LLLAVLISTVSIPTASAQLSPPAQPASQSQSANQLQDGTECAATRLVTCAKDVLVDQEHIWTSPLRIKKRDLKWIVPLTASVAAALYWDSDALDEFGQPHTAVVVDKHFSDYASPYVLLGTSVGLYGLGSLTHSDRVRETGILGSEAIVDTLILVGGLKLATQRDRPDDDPDGEGEFWPHGTRKFNFSSAMPSGHAAAVWALAKVVSSEYPDKRWLGLLAYSGAVSLSTARVLSRRHFPSDVLVGSAVGYLTGRYVMHHHSSRRVHFDLAPIMDGQTRGLSLNIQP